MLVLGNLKLTRQSLGAAHSQAEPGNETKDPAVSRASIYDEVAFPSYPYSHSHPERLATIARLCGLQAAAPTACRVLELGCGAGGNILPMADILPESQF